MTANSGRKKAKPKLSHFIFITLVFMAVALIYVWFHVNITRLNYKIASEMSRKGSLMEENKRLKMEVAALKSSNRIEKIARVKLEMHYPDEDQVVFVR